MKTLITISLALLMSYTVKAQKARVGFVAGANYSNLVFSNTGDSDPINGMKPGITGGVVTEIDFGRLSIQPTVLFSQKGTMDKYSQDDVTVKERINLSYFELPVNVVYNFSSGRKGHFFAGAGPYIAWLASAKYKLKMGDFKDSEWLNVGAGADNDLKEIDYGLNALVGYRPSVNFSVSVHYTRGLCNLIPDVEDSEVKLMNQNFSLRIGYYFKGKQD